VTRRSIRGLFRAFSLMLFFCFAIVSASTCNTTV
jgi:hypothetical protein